MKVKCLRESRIHDKIYINRISGGLCDLNSMSTFQACIFAFYHHRYLLQHHLPLSVSACQTVGQLIIRWVRRPENPLKIHPQSNFLQDKVREHNNGSGQPDKRGDVETACETVKCEKIVRRFI